MKSWGLFITPLLQILTVNGKVRDSFGCSVTAVVLHAVCVKNYFRNETVFKQLVLTDRGQKTNTARGEEFWGPQQFGRNCMGCEW